ncbi:MAG: hypothetical protein IT159_03125 [Bryobacterales bacterium]|nr:hypothetical protein [Bryobacterales bacterium]
MSSSAPGLGRRSPAEARAAIERFLNASRQPILLEPGEDPFKLEAGCYELHWSGERLSVQAWDRDRNLVRRVLGLGEERPGKLELVIEKFPKREGRILLLDAARPSMRSAPAKGRRLAFRERFRRLLGRSFPGWKVAELSTELDLEHSLSSLYPRALLRRGMSGRAAIASPPEGPPADGVLSFGLVWLDHLRRREPRLTIEGLTVFLPEGREQSTCLRLRWLDPAAARVEAFVYSTEDHAARADLADYGNLDTRLEPFRDPARSLTSRVHGWVERLSRLPGVEPVPLPGGAASLRVRGMEFALAQAGTLRFGLHGRAIAGESNLAEIEALARQLARWRSADPPDRENPLYRAQPERWLESAVRADLEEIDAALASGPVYGQVPAFAGGERGVLDLVAVERTGRLVVLELKASEDIHLPLQALDYWMRVQWHLERDEFRTRGYFPGTELRRELPRLLLVAPSLDFHPATDVIVRCLSPRIPVERIGLGVEWRRKAKVVFRKR